MTKAIIHLGYTDYVLDIKEAVAVAEMLSKAEVYESKYVKDGDNTHHIYSNNKKEVATLRLITDEFYNMCRLAGQPKD